MKFNLKLRVVLSVCVALMLLLSAASAHALRSAPPPSTKPEMQDMPKGTLCGLYMMTQSSLKARVYCLGHNPLHSCPSGFKRADLGYFEAGGGTRKWVTCIKL